MLPLEWRPSLDLSERSFLVLLEDILLEDEEAESEALVEDDFEELLDG